MSKKNLFILLLIIGTAFWGISFPLVKSGVGSSAPFVFLAYRFCLAALVMLLLFPASIHQFTADTLRTAAFLAIPLFLGIVLQTYGLKYSPAGQCAFIAGLCVVTLPLVNLLIYGKPIATNLLLASLLAIAGLYTISIKDGFSIGLGDIYTLLGTVGFAFYLINVSRQSTTQTLIPSVTLMFALCGLLAFALGAFSTDSQWITTDKHFWVGVAFSSLLSTAYMYSVSNKAQQYIEAEKVALIYLFEPIFASVAAFFLLGEPFTWRLLLGGSLIIAATLVSELKTWQRVS
ncbi:DMT family transporter [Spirosoma koreense]